jgi:Ca-activated chloride channel family protein
VVAFSDAGFATQVPTDDRPAVAAAIARLGPERGTSIGRGIEEALSVIDVALHPPSTDYYTNRSAAPAAPTPVPTPVPTGYFEPAVIVLLTDGENTVKPDPFAAATAARDRGIRIDTIGIGTPAGATLEVEGFRVHTQLDEATLRQVAAITDGTYYAADSQDELTRIYDEVGSRLVVRTEPFELTPLLAAAGFAFLLAGGLGSLRWFGRMP